VPTVVFTIPPLAAVGLLEHAARQKGLNFRINQEDTSVLVLVAESGGDFAGSKVLIENGSDPVLGAHVIGPHANELINVFALAMQADIPASQLRPAIFSYPHPGFRREVHALTGNVGHGECERQLFVRHGSFRRERCRAEIKTEPFAPQRDRTIF